MSSLDGKHFYRFRYLRSEHWSNLRLQKLADCDACCERCGKRNLSNDVHHLRYRKLFDVTTADLVVLCRKCHDLTHEALALFREKIKSAKEDRTWFHTLRAIAVTRRKRAKEKRKPALGSAFTKATTIRDESQHFQELGDVFREIRKLGGFSVVVDVN